MVTQRFVERLCSQDSVKLITCRQRMRDRRGGEDNRCPQSAPGVIGLDNPAAFDEKAVVKKAALRTQSNNTLQRA